ncbi:MAG: hypothetical protein JWO09_1086 [Bacteroidetes bacterium]|nr:hypothetical protein [Bacteroidota bacterium]
MKKILLACIVTLGFFSSCDSQTRKRVGRAASDAATQILNSQTGSGSSTPLSNDEVINGLKEALTVGTNNSTAFASKLDGYYKNPALFIPFPEEAKKVKEYAVQAGLGSQVDKFEMTLNRAAEEAAKDAAPVFINAVKSMSITDGFAILKGADNAATQYLKDKTTAELILKFSPIVQKAIDKVELTKYWNPIITAYNKVPFVQKQNPDLTAYVTDRAIQGLFKLIADEELKIRKDPVARVTDILKRVFGSLGK